MLVLTRKQQEVIKIGENVTITILRIKGQSVRVGIDAPSNIKVIRGELELLLSDDGDDLLTNDRSHGSAAEEEEIATDSDASGARSGLHPAAPDQTAPRLSESKNRLPQSAGPSAPQPQRSCVEEQKCPGESTLAFLTRKRTRRFSSN
jgi:carbon storage regulator CsrA